MEILIWVVIVIIYVVIQAMGKAAAPRPEKGVRVRPVVPKEEQPVSPPARTRVGDEVPTPGDKRPRERQVVAVVTPSRRRRLVLSRSDVRRAVLLREILGPPRGME